MYQNPKSVPSTKVSAKPLEFELSASPVLSAVTRTTPPSDSAGSGLETHPRRFSEHPIGLNFRPEEEADENDRDDSLLKRSLTKGREVELNLGAANFRRPAERDREGENAIVAPCIFFCRWRESDICESICIW